MNESNQITKLLEQGLADYGLGKLEDAVKSWQKVLELDPDNRRAKEYLEFVRSAWGPRPSAAENRAPSATGSGQPQAGSVFASGPPETKEPSTAGQDDHDGSEFTKPKTDTTGWGNLFELPEDTKDDSPQGAHQPGPEVQQPTPALPPHPPLPPDSAAVQEPEQYSVRPADEHNDEASVSQAQMQNHDPAPVIHQGPWEQQVVVAAETPMPPVASQGSANHIAEPPQGSDALDLVGGGNPTPEPQAASAAETELDSLLKGAADLMELDDFSGALELIEKILQIDPENHKALQWKSEAEQQLLAMYRSKLGDMSRIPQVRISREEIIWLNLDHRAGYLLSLVDGRLTLDEIIAVCGLPELQALRLLAELVQDNVIEVG